MQEKMHPPGPFLCACNPALGWAFGCSRTGASHLRALRPNEDAFAVWSGSSGSVPGIAVAIADGHGDPRHDLSGTGSALAVQAAVEELAGFHRMHLHAIPPHILRSEFRADFPRRVTRRWREAVRADAGMREAAQAAGGAVPDEAVRYGSTLLAALIVPDTLLIGQIGDGDIVFVRPDGSVEFPIPADTRLVGAETRSLSSGGPRPSTGGRAASSSRQRTASRTPLTGPRARSSPPSSGASLPGSASTGLRALPAPLPAGSTGTPSSRAGTT